jgi:two-component system chemotaxis response regulator CheB
MPRNAIEAARIDHVVPLDEIGAVIETVVDTLPDARTTSDPGEENAPYQAPEDPGPPSELTCPACGGVLTTTGDDPLRFRCRVGHAYNVDSLLVSQDDALEQSLWTALRALEERGALLDRLSSRFSKRGNDRQAERFAEDRDVVEQRAAIVRRALLDPELLGGGNGVTTTKADVDDEPEDVAG